MKIIKRIPLSLKVSGFLTIALGILWVYVYQTNINANYITQQKRIRNRIISAMTYSEQAFKSGEKVATIAKDLNRRIVSKDIRFYMLTSNNKIIYAKHRFKSIELEILKFRIIDNSFRSFNDAFYAAKKFKNYKLYIGAHISKEAMISNGLKDNLLDFILDLSFIFVVAYILMEILVRYVILSLLLKFNKTKKVGPLMNALMSKELEMVADGIDGFHEDYDILKESYKIVEEQIPEAIRTALLNKREDFEKIKCAMASTDINNSSTIQDQFPSDIYIPIFKQVMNTITSIVKSYGGNSYKFVGDEIIYYFNENKDKNAATLAISAVRDINNAIKKIDEQSFKKYGLKITTKSSMAYGTITFTMVNNIFEIMGGCITEATRILSLVEDKSVNSLYVNKDIKERSDQIIDFEYIGKFKLKGLEIEREIYNYQNHQPIDILINSIDLTKTKKLTYYRNPKDIIKTTSYLKNNITTVTEKLFLEIVTNWGHFPSIFRGSKFRDEIIDFLKFLDELVKNEKTTTRYRYYLSYSISLVHNLISNELFNKELSDLLLNFISNKYSQRVVANAVEVLGLYDYNDSDEIFIKLLKHNNNRVRSNAIVAEGINNFDNKVFKKLKKLLRSKEKLYVASGIYAARVIIGHHKQNKRIYNVNQLFKKTLKELYRHTNDNNEMIKRQLTHASNELEDNMLLPKS